MSLRRASSARDVSGDRSPAASVTENPLHVLPPPEAHVDLVGRILARAAQRIREGEVELPEKWHERRPSRLRFYLRTGESD